jgi:uncharacterized protein (TIGR02099 family)
VAKRIAGHFFRTLWLVTAVLVILYAVVIVAGRELLPVVNRYQPEINRYLTETTGLDFHVERLSGLWQGFTPSVALDHITITGADGESEALYINTLSAELDTVKSLFNMSPVWHKLRADRIRLHLVEDREGHWTIAGHPLGGRGGNLYYVNRMFYYSRLLRIDSLDLTVEFYSGARSEMTARNIQVDNSDGFHRITASLLVDGAQRNSASFIFEGQGDPADPEDFVGSGYLNLNQVNLTGSISNLLGRLFPEQLAEIGEVETDLDLEFWFGWQHNALVNGRGRLKASEIPLNWLQGSPPVTEFSASLTAWATPGEDWGFQLGDIRGQWRGAAIGPLAFSLRQGVGSRWGELDLTTSRVDLALLTRIAQDTGLVEGAALEALTDLSPAGRLNNLQASFDFSSDEPKVSVRANLDKVAVGSWRGTPQARDVDGFVHAELNSGYVVLDSPDGFAMRYPQVYDDFMSYGAATGKVSWQIERDLRRVLVSSNVIALNGEEGEGRGLLHLDLPFDKAGDPLMFLMVGLKNSHSRYLDRYLPQKGLNNQLREWLGSAIGDAVVDEAGFIWRGSLQKTNHNGRSIQVYGKFADAEVDYWPGWPSISGASGKFVVDNVEMDAWLDAGIVDQTPVDSMEARVRHSDTGKPVLEVAADVETPLPRALKMLANSPLSSRLGRLDNLEIKGDAQVDLDLRIPLSEDQGEADYRVIGQLQGASLRLPGTTVWIEGIEGSVNYSLARGLSARQLEGRLLGNAIQAELKTKEEGLSLAVNSLVDLATVDNYLQGYGQHLRGKTHVSGRMLIPVGAGDDDVRLNLTSTLTGIEVDLPRPFAKSAEEQARMDATVDFTTDTTRVKAAVQYRGALAMAFEGDRFTAGEIALLADDAAVPEIPGLLVSGRLEKFNWQAWQPLLLPEKKPGSDPVPAADYRGLAPRFDLHFDSLSLGDFDLGTSHLGGGLVDREWQFELMAEQAEGLVVIPVAGDQPPRLDFGRLNLPEWRKASEASERGGRGDESGLNAIDPGAIAAFDFRVEKLYVGQQQWGNLAFNARPVDSGVALKNLEGSFRGIDLQPRLAVDEASDAMPATLRWTRQGDEHITHFTGGLLIDDVESVFEEWQVPAPLRSESAALYADLRWQGRPWEARLLALEGYLGIDFVDGHFYKTTSPGTNTLFKLISLINFDTWLRRLRFDFSDLFSEGVSFDEVRGGLLFQRGQLTFDEPLVASMPSGRIRLMGSANLEEETLNGRLVATVPVGTNLPWVAGLLGGLPAAAGVFLTSKIFEKQVDQLSSLSYRIGGTFDDPDVEVERVFTDPYKTDPHKTEPQKESD